MTWNKDRKQTKYGHMRREHMTHTTEPWHNSPLPEGVSHAVTVPPGRGGGRSAEQTTETMAELGALEAMAELGALETMAELGALETMAVQGAQEAMAGHLRGLGLGPLGPAPTAGTLSTPQKNFPGVFRGYQEPSGAKQTGQDRDRTTHRNRKPSWTKLGSWGFLWAWRGVRGPYRVPQQPLPSQQQGGRRLEWPPWSQQEEPPAPD